MTRNRSALLVAVCCWSASSACPAAPPLQPVDPVLSSSSTPRHSDWRPPIRSRRPSGSTAARSPTRSGPTRCSTGRRPTRPHMASSQRYVRTIFTDQIAATEGIEYTRFGQWKFDPATAPTTAPDLVGIAHTDRRVQQDVGRRDCAALEFTAQPRLRAGSVGCDGGGGRRPPPRPAVPAGAVVGDPVLLRNYLSSRDIRRSASTLPPVWQVGQY